jgi:hypothetical protein
MPRERTCSKWILIAALVSQALWARADEPEAHGGEDSGRFRLVVTT